MKNHIKYMVLPKVLIIGQPFNNDTGGGITLTNLFNGWPRNKLAVASSGYLLRDNVDTQICNIYYQLGHKENKWVFPFRILQRKYYSGPIEFDEKRIQNLSIKKSKLRVKLIMKYFIPLLNFLGLAHIISKTELSPEFCNWADKYKPDVLYMQASSRADILFCIAVHDYLKKPIVFHMMDDWPSSISAIGLFNKFWRNRIDHDFRELLDRATVLMSIGEAMSVEYKKRYKKDFIPFHNTIDIEFWKKHQRDNYVLNESPTILYAGRIGVGIDTSLELVAKAIQKVNKELNTSIKFILQTQWKPEWIDNYDYIIHNNFVSYNDLPKVFSEADFLLLPYDFTPESIRFIQYSMPTKVPEYMVSGTPIIIFAPEVTAIVEYAEKYEWAKVITENKVEFIADTIKQLVTDIELRQRITKNAKRIAEEHHSSCKIATQFQNVILSTIN